MRISFTNYCKYSKKFCLQSKSTGKYIEYVIVIIKNHPISQVLPHNGRDLSAILCDDQYKLFSLLGKWYYMDNKRALMYCRIVSAQIFRRDGANSLVH